MKSIFHGYIRSFKHVTQRFELIQRKALYKYVLLLCIVHIKERNGQ